jgi:hypothetical protein
MFEDDDFSLRVKTAGYRVVTAEDCFIHHFGNGSFAKLPTEESLRIFEQNKQRFETKWKTSWVPHKLRPDARSPFEEMRFTPAELLTVGGAKSQRQQSPAILHRISPEGCAAGEGFHLQENGDSALIVECEQVNPGTVVMMNGTMLTTAYGNQRMLSALVPAALYTKPGKYPVYLVNDFGESNRLEFVVD